MSIMEYIEYCEDDTKNWVKRDIQYNEYFEEDTKEDNELKYHSIHEKSKYPCQQCEYKATTVFRNTPNLSLVCISYRTSRIIVIVSGEIDGLFKLQIYLWQIQLKW